MKYSLKSLILRIISLFVMDKKVSSDYFDLCKKTRFDIMNHVYHCSSISFLFCVNGAVKIKSNSTCYDVVPSTLIAIFPDGELEEIEIIPPFEYFFIALKRPLFAVLPIVQLSDILLDLLEHPVMTIGEREREHLLNLCMLLFDIMSMHDDDNMQCAVSLITTITYYLHSVFCNRNHLILYNSDRPNTFRLLVDQCIPLIHQYSTNQRFVSFYACKLNVSTSVLNNAFHQVLGCSVTQVIHNTLISYAKIRLMTSADSISVIAYDLGFKSPSNFVSFFKKYTQESPELYRSHYLSL